MSITDTPTATVADQARKAADYLDAHDWPSGTDIRISADISPVLGQARAIVSVDTLDVDALIATRRTVGPMDRCEDTVGGGFYFRAKPYDGLVVQVNPPAGVCERVQIGTREIPVYETTCPDSVLALGNEVPA